MTKLEVLTRIAEIGIIPAVRVFSREDALFASETLLSGGIPIVEITATVPAAAEVVAELKRRGSDLILGAGTVLDLDTARRFVDAGAMFLTSTGLDLEVVEFAAQNDIAMIPGALTPTEVMAAFKAGSEYIKLFPCSAMGGANYVRALKGPFPHVHFVASGGVSQQTVSDFIYAGATAIGVGQDLLPKDAIRGKNVLWIHELTRRFLGMVQEARSHS
jgi:2-dehydro-3-deoxyphosphogluconate aldolase/(4S)-4-hydroxy-2-oxoglutarate aldolase